MNRVKFFSENDLSCGINIERIIEIAIQYDDALELDIDRLLEFYNTLKFIKIERFKKRIEKEVGINLDNFVKQIEKKIGIFIANRKTSYLDLYELVDFQYRKDFFEVMDKYKVYQNIIGEDLKGFIIKYGATLYYILKYKNIVQYHDKVLKGIFLANSNNAELILDKHLSEKDLNLPQSLHVRDIEYLIDSYLDLEHLNTNHLRKIIYFPPNAGLIICDKLKLKAKRRLKKEEERIFKGGSGLEMGAEISFSDELDEAVRIETHGAVVKYTIQKKWIADNLDFNTLLNNFIYIFNFFDEQCRLNLATKINEAGILERVIWDKEDHLYKAHSVFKINEMISSIQLLSYSNYLSIYEIRIEDLIEWFFKEYLKDEFSIIGFIVRMPSERLTYFEKCRFILPEIDRILKQYNIYTENCEIDQELLQMSSKPMSLGAYLSKVQKKYIYPNSSYYYNAVNRLFSDQSGLAYIPKLEVTHRNLCELILKEKVKLNDFEQYQRVEIQWLLDNGLLGIDKEEYLIFEDHLMVEIFGDLFYNEVISYWNNPNKTRRKIDGLVSDGTFKMESSLFSKNEQDYMDYYLNKAKFTNGYDLRNCYAHGTHSNDEKQHELDYYIFLRIIIILVVKINDDLCSFEETISRLMR